ncbi:MAG: hypothetical protein RL700_367 [Pseudomonadota bacterium]|jgi:hypothetical protein
MSCNDNTYFGIFKAASFELGKSKIKLRANLIKFMQFIYVSKIQKTFLRY